MTVLKGAAATDVGRVRQVNEDRFLVTDVLFAVADGVGGHQAGEVAAETSVEALADSFTERTTEGLIDAIQQANQAVWRLAQAHVEKRGMGTTLTALALVQEDGEDQLAVANVGDSRAYLFQRGELVQVSEDHSLVEELVREGQLTPAEAQVHPQRSIITRALGMEPEIKVDAWTLIPYAGDRIVLCSDGLTNEVSDDRIASTLRQLSNPQEVAHDLVRQARTHGGNDNITVVVVDVVDDGGRAERASAALGQSAKRSTGKTADSAAWARLATGSDSGAGPGPGSGSRSSSGSGSRSGSISGSPGSRSGRALATDMTIGQMAAPPALESAAPVARNEPDERPPAKSQKVRPRRFTWRVAAFVFLVLAVLGVGVGSVAWYARSAYFVGLADNQVAIYKGRPGGILWFEPTLVERKPLRVDEVLSAKVDELRAGKEEATKADADRYVNNLRQEAAQRRADATSTSTTTPTTTPVRTSQP